MIFKKKFKLLLSFFCIFSYASCVKEDNKNLVVESKHRDPRVDNFFNAVGLPLEEVNANNLEKITADLTRVSPLFTNAIPPKEGESAEDAPFFPLAKNVGAYFTSQVWKTQITSPEDVRFFDLGQNVNDVSGLKYLAENFNLPFVFVNSHADKNDPKNYLGSVVNGFYGKLNFATKEFSPMSHFYIMEYKLRDENGSRNGPNVRTYYALVSVPINPTKQYRLVMYSHVGDFGTSTSELILIFADKLKDFVVVAPLFPGEPLCTQINAQNRGCLRLDKDNNIVPDTIGHYNNPEVSVPFHSITPIHYPRSPLAEDINAFLGAHNAVARTMNLSLNGSNPFYSETLSNHSKLLTLENTNELINYFQSSEDEFLSPNGMGVRMIPTDLAPQTLGVGASRGGGVLMSSIGRIGFLMNGISLATQFPHSVQDNENETFYFQYPLFNSAALFFPPTSFLTGKLRLLAMMVMENDIESISALPMTSDLAKNSFFSNYRNDSNYPREIQSPILRSDGSVEASAQDSLTQLVTFVASNDVTFLAPFIASGLQNWNSFYFEKNMRAPGSLILLHGSQDLIVPMTESTIGAGAMNTVWAGLYHTPIDPYGKYLSDLKFNSMHPFLVGGFIPGAGVAQYTFQPTDHFFNIPCDKKMLAQIQQPDVIYNTNVGRCFGGGYSPNASGQNAQGTFYGHMDAAFFSGRLLNTLPENNLSLAVLSSNVLTDAPANHYTMSYDAKHMRHGTPKYQDDETCVDGHDNCTFPYILALTSPTFMRYMAFEGMLGEDIVVAKKQIFEGAFKPKNDSNLTPHDVFFTWLNSVACDLCETKNETHFGVFHDFGINEIK